MRTIHIDNKDEIARIIQACKTCYVAMSLQNVPYVLPLNFGYDGTYVILHSAQSGRMWETLKQNPKVCINWTLGDEIVSQNEEVACSYRVKSKTVIAEGVAEFINDCDEKIKCLDLMMSQYSNKKFKYSEPSVINVGVIRVKINNIKGKEFGVIPKLPGKQ